MPIWNPIKQREPIWKVQSRRSSVGRVAGPLVMMLEGIGVEKKITVNNKLMIYQRNITGAPINSKSSSSLGKQKIFGLGIP